jgi:hypothetical protein
MSAPITCEEARAAIPLFLYGELSFDAEDAFEVHVETCQACRAELTRERAFQRAFDDAELAVTPEMLYRSRQSLAAALAGDPPQPATFWGRLRERLAFRWHVPSIATPMGALALVAMGFFGARLIPQTSQGPVPLTALSLVEQDPIASRVRYLEPEPSGRIQIVVEETRQRTLSGNLGDERIQRLLLTAAQDPSDPGLRVESMDLLKNRPEASEVRQALLLALQHDPNAGVRLKALEGLKGSVGDPEVRQILARVLLADQNPGVRTEVIDLLIRKPGEPQMAGILQELMRKEDNGYVRMRCQRALYEMKASVGTF